MAIKDKNFSTLKTILFTVLIVTLFFGSLEVIQRVRYFFRFGSTYWLFFGFVNMPKDYYNMLEKGLEKGSVREAENKRGKVEFIEVPSVFYKGYRKYNPKYKTDEFSINQYGFRGKPFNAKKEKGVFRIVALGGSTTFGTSSKDGETYPEFLEKDLNSSGAKRYEVINAGIGAANIKEISELFRHEVIQLDPDEIVINSVFNNIYFSGATYERKRTLLQRLNQFLRRRSLFYMTLREKLSVMLHKPIDDLYKASMEQILYNFLHDEMFWRMQEEVFGDIIKLAKANGIKVALVKEPVMLCNSEEKNTWMLLDRKFEGVYKKEYALLDKVARDEGAAVIDASGAFNSSPDRDSLFADGLHLTPKGNKYLAGLIAEEIKKR